MDSKGQGMTNLHFKNYSHYYSDVLPNLGIADLMSSYAGADHGIIILLNPNEEIINGGTSDVSDKPIGRDFKRSPQRALNTASQNLMPTLPNVRTGSMGSHRPTAMFPTFCSQDLFILKKCIINPKAFVYVIYNIRY